MKTAEEFLKDYYNEGSGPGESEYYDIESVLIKFTKLHLQAQLDSILSMVSMNINNGNVRYTCFEYPGKSREVITIDERSIREAYPLENVK